MKSKRRFVPVFWLCLVAVLILSATVVGGQNAPSVSSTLSARTWAALPAPTAKAYPAAAPKPAAAAASSIEPDPSRKWEVEVHFAGTLSFNPRGGQSLLPPSGPGFTGPGGNASLQVQSWYFGAGAILYNTVVLNHPATLSQRIASLDGVLTSPVTRRDDGPGFGARISRELTPRFSVEGSVDYNLGALALYGAGDKINQTSATWQAAFTQLLNLPNCFACTGVSVSSVPAIHDHQGHELLATGGLVVNVRTRGRAIPYLSAGGGAIFSLGDTPSATLVGNYTFTFLGAPHNETDSIRLHYGVPDHTVVGYFGGGVKYYVTPHWGLRVEARDYVSAYHVDNLLDAAPAVATLTPAQATNEGGNPDLVFSNNPSTGIPSSLSAPALTNFRTFRGDGVLHQVEFTFGIFFRF